MVKSPWVKVGVSTVWTMLLLALGLAVVGGVAIAGPVLQLVAVVSGVVYPFWPVAIITVAVMFVLVAVPLVIFSNRPVWINLDAGLVRVGWRTIRLDELRHAYRMPGGPSMRQFVVQLELVGGLDARLPVRSAALPDLSARELGVLIEAIERSSVVPRPGMPMRSPIAGELGPRSDQERRADAMADAVAPFGRISYAKPTLLAELREVLAEWNGTTSLPELPPESRAADALSAGIEIARRGGGRRRSRLSILPEQELPRTVPYGRGLLGTAGAKYREHRDEVEAWLLSVTGTALAKTGTDRRVLGWLLVLAGFLLPWLTFIMAFTVIFIAFLGVAESFLWALGISLFVWPLVAWSGMLLIHSARIRRHVAARSAVVAAAGSAEVPDRVKDFFGAPLPQRAYALHVYLYLLALFIVFLAAGLMFLSLGYGQVGEPYVPQAWQIPLGVLLLVPAIPSFVAALRWQRHMWAELARARVEWALLSQ